MKVLLAACAVIGSLSAPQMALADTGSQTVNISVSTDRLDLSHPSDVRRLRVRISQAAASACDPADRFIVTPLPDYQCRRAAIASVEPAVQQMARAAKRNAVASIN